MSWQTTPAEASGPADSRDSAAISAVMAPPPELNLLGYRLHPMTTEEVIAQVSAAVAEHRRLIMANLNVHGMAKMYDSPGMARLHAQRDCMVMIDGMPVLHLANMMLDAKLGYVQRTTSLDFYDDMFSRGVTGNWSFAYVGARPEVMVRGTAILRERFPDIRFEGRDGYFDINDFGPESRNTAIIEWLRELSPDVLIVGMGMPRQEEWIERIQHLIDARVILPTGAYLDYQTGAQRPPPRWLGRYGLEWAYRFLRSPYRLGYRYLVEPFILTYRILKRRPLPDRQPSEHNS